MVYNLTNNYLLTSIMFIFPVIYYYSDKYFFQLWFISDYELLHGGFVRNST